MTVSPRAVGVAARCLPQDAAKALSDDSNATGSDHCVGEGGGGSKGGYDMETVLMRQQEVDPGARGPGARGPGARMHGPTE